MDNERYNFPALFGGSREATLVLSGSTELYRNAAADALLQGQPLSVLFEELPEGAAAFSCTLFQLPLNALLERLDDLRILRLFREEPNPLPMLLVSELRDRIFSQQLTLERLLEQLSEEDNELYGTPVRRSSCSLYALADGLSELSQLGEGGLVCFPKRFDLAQLYGDVLFSISVLLPEKYPPIDMQADESCIVEADPERMEELLLLLLHSALCRSGTEGGISVKLRREKDSVRILVEDSGEEMDAAALSALFSAEPQTLQSGRASLELALVRGIIEAHGGRILLQSHGQKGTRALASLPLSADQDSPVAECIPPEGMTLVQRIMADLLDLSAFRAVFDD